MPRVVDAGDEVSDGSSSDKSHNTEESKVEIDPELAWVLDPFAPVPEKFQQEENKNANQ